MVNKKKHNNKRFTDKQISKAISVPIVDYIEAKGIGKLIQHGHNYMKLQYDGHDSLVIDLRNNQFIHNAYKHEKNAYGNIINFVQYINDNQIDFREAVQEILEFAGEDYIPVERIIEEKEFIYDYVEAKYNSRAYNYLVKERGIHHDIVKRLFNERYIIQDKYNNVIFNWTADGLPPKDTSNIIGATQQTTRKPDDGMPSKWIKEGSQKDCGFNIQLGNHIESIYFFEASIDLLSYWSLYRENLNHCRLVSLEGLKPETLKTYLSQVTEAGYAHFNVYMCIDNDGAAHRLMESIPVTAITSPVRIFEEIPFQNVLTAQEYQQLHEASEAYATNLEQIVMVYLAERPFLSKPTTKEKEQLSFTEGIEKGVAKISSAIKKHPNFEFFLRENGYTERQRDRIERWQIEGIMISEEAIKDWNDYLKEHPTPKSVEQAQHHRQLAQTEAYERESSKTALLHEREGSALSLQDTVRQTTRRLTIDDLERLSQTTVISRQVLKIFADKGWLRKSGQEDAYILLWSREGKVTGAEQLSPSLDYQLTQQNSKEGESFIFTVGKPENLYLFESSKEAMSYLSLHPHKRNAVFIVVKSEESITQKIQEYLNSGNIKSITSTFDSYKIDQLKENLSIEVNRILPISESWHQDIANYQEYQVQKRYLDSLEKTLKKQQKQLDAKIDQQLTVEMTI